jgi:hypothetical protein
VSVGVVPGTKVEVVVGGRGGIVAEGAIVAVAGVPVVSEVVVEVSN